MNTWSIKLSVRDDGGVGVEEVTYGIPPGEIVIRGSDDGTISAHHHHRRDRAGAGEGPHDPGAAAGGATAAVSD
jgi:hypothetical protein